MATTVIKSSPTHGPAPSSRSLASRAFRAIDAVYRFLASLKLAVISLTTLAAVLAYATFFESWYGAAAVQEWIYMSPGFALLLAFLGANILCAALIRFPWKKRQTGFVITHAGLLVLLAGSWYSLQHADEGQLGMLEGDVSSQMVRVDHPVIRIRELDPHTRQPVRESTIPFEPGFFPWGQGTPRPRWLATRLFHKATFGLFDTPRREDQSEVLTRPRRPVPAGREGAPARLDADGRARGRPRRRAHGQDSCPLQGAREGRAFRDLRRGERRALVQAREAALSRRQGRQPRPLRLHVRRSAGDGRRLPRRPPRRRAPRGPRASDIATSRARSGNTTGRSRARPASRSPSPTAT